MRLFIAFPLSTSVKEQLTDVVNSLSQRGGPVKWVEPKNMHITARFLGDTPDNKVDSLKKILDTVAPTITPVAATIQQLGAFPNIHRPRVLWLGLQGFTEPMAAAAVDIEKQVVALGFPPEPKSFKAHLTLGRVKEGQRIGNTLDYLRTFTFSPIPVLFDRLTLYKSTLTPKGPIYDILHEARFK